MLTVRSAMEYVPKYKNLKVWQKADKLILFVYKLTKLFPKEELFGLVSRIRRYAVSVPANMVEGYGRGTKNDKVQFYPISKNPMLGNYLTVSLNH
jgi:hypothetical protein